MSQQSAYLAARRRETLEAQQIVESLKMSIDQGCSLGVEHLAIESRFYDDEDIEVHMSPALAEPEPTAQSEYRVIREITTSLKKAVDGGLPHPIRLTLQKLEDSNIYRVLVNGLHHISLMPGPTGFRVYDFINLGHIEFERGKYQYIKGTKEISYELRTDLESSILKVALIQLLDM